MPQSSNFRVTSRFLVNKQAVPVSDWSLDLNAYSLASSIEATVTRGVAKGFPTLPDFSKLAQTIAPVNGIRAVPLEIHCGYDLMPSRKNPHANLLLEMGLMDECEYGYDERTVTITGRGQASIFQDIQVAKPVDRSQGGDKIVKAFFKEYAPNIKLTAEPSPAFIGKTTGDAVYNITMRDRTVFDEMQACALDDGFQLTVHSNQATYGPPGTGPVLNYAWGRAHRTGGGITNLRIKHSPRRSHNIKVVVRSYLRRGKHAVFGTYGSASATQGETFNFFISGKTHPQVIAKAQQIWYDIARREFLVTATIIPDVAFMQCIVDNGANFSINLSGGPDFAESHKLTYGVRQCRLEFNNQRLNLPLRAHIIMGNVNPIQSGAFIG